MANFFLIDHSLRQAGGHHFDYVRCIAQAATEQGFETTIGTHRSFTRGKQSSSVELALAGKVRRTFRKTTYQPTSNLAGLQHLTRSNHSELLRRPTNPTRRQRIRLYWNQYRHQQGRDQFIRTFAQDCQRFFQNATLTGDDHAFLTTVSELELLGLAAFLNQLSPSQQRAMQTQWHLQFHYNLFEGRTPEYDSQDHIAIAVKQSFRAALAKLSYHPIRFYATSETLADQYNRLDVGEFHVLPYPIADEFHQEAKQPAFTSDLAIVKFDQSAGDANAITGSLSDSISFKPWSPGSAADSELETSDPHSSSLEPHADACQPVTFKQPLRIVCPGELRREKGHLDYLQPLVDEIWPTHLATGNVRLVLQRPAKKRFAKKQKIEITTPESTTSDDGDFPIEYVTHPLDYDNYVDLIRSADCGLLFYNSRAYFSRRAGVLGELLAMGKPVIVSAGSWLADQIQEPTFRHAEQVRASATACRSLETFELDWQASNVPMPGNVLAFNQSKHPFVFSVDCEARENCVLVEFDWHWPDQHGTYARIEVTQRDASDNLLGETTRVVGFRYCQQRPNGLFPLCPDASRLEVKLTNAFHDSSATIKNIDVQMLQVSESATSGIPLGAVGIAAADQADLANCIDELSKHYDHYQRSAAAFSKPWFASHRPERTVAHLTGESQAISRAA